MVVVVAHAGLVAGVVPVRLDLAHDAELGQQLQRVVYGLVGHRGMLLADRVADGVGICMRVGGDRGEHGNARERHAHGRLAQQLLELNRFVMLHILSGLF